MINLQKVEYDLTLQDQFPEDACYLAGLIPAYKHIKRWMLPRCYVGAAWPEYYSAGIGRSRDSDALERSNFEVMFQELGAEGNEHWPGVTIVSENHWAVGWVEWIAIHQTNYVALAIADKLLGKLQDYPILDEEHFSELEQEEADQTWRECYDWRDRIAYIRAHEDQFEFRSREELFACVRGDFFGGYASELIHG